ncbi:hypothetical protein SAMN04488503_2298 [Humidesulfovibrio mexicanus]|uniref:Uncharacterized protein n=1 Tax=Humidesulfovibrio mexicanus TaxID=147047 RepID=A0A239AY05_9BACT|nr:hypothetical protein [Humidesulfovibrio mexicanus]SNS00507.1 hypothetical protein SAMN04488503_2298 [Humidesulfovibrio mexicanus]
MYARIIDGRVAERTEKMPALGETECALIVEVDADVQVGWLWTPEGCVAPTAPPAPDPNAAIDAEILALEATVTQRRLREALLTDEGKTWLAEVEARIAALRTARA